MQKPMGGGLRDGACLKVVTVSLNKVVKALFSWADVYGMEVSFKKALSLM